MEIIKKIKISKEFVIAIVVSIVVTILYGSYILTIGRRTTEARNLYLNGYNAYEEGKKDKALEYLYESQNKWSSKETTSLIEKIEDED